VCVLIACGLVAAIGGCDAPRPIRIRVLTYNIHHGQGEDGKFDLPRLARVISDLKPDLAALQEVDCGTKRASGADQAAELGRLTGMHAVFGKAMDFSGGQYGQAVLSRWPILHEKTHQLGHDPDSEPRIALSVSVRPVADRPEFTFVGTHLDHVKDHRLRLRQARRLNELFVKDDGGPVILVGDLNDTPQSEPIKAMSEHWLRSAGDAPQATWPAKDPAKKIDYILLRPAGRWRVVEVRVIEEKIASDHRPVLAVLEWRGLQPDLHQQGDGK
jgi:endonuclease/exonuclease/phosphatase family metal-dependent hydrolase